MKKLISVVLVLIMVFSMGTAAFADSGVNYNKNNNFRITRMSDNLFYMSDGKEKGFMKIKETKTSATITVEVNNQVEGYFLLNRVNGTVYSSYTGNTISVSEIRSNEEITPFAVGDVVSRTTSYISYAKLAESVKAGNSIFSKAAAIISIVAILQGVVIASATLAVASLISAYMSDIIDSGLVNKSTSHGVKAVVARVEIQKHQGGGMAKGYKYDIEAISTY